MGALATTGKVGKPASPVLEALTNDFPNPVPVGTSGWVPGSGSLTAVTDPVLGDCLDVPDGLQLAGASRIATAAGQFVFFSLRVRPTGATTGFQVWCNFHNAGGTLIEVRAVCTRTVMPSDSAILLEGFTLAPPDATSFWVSLGGSFRANQASLVGNAGDYAAYRSASGTDPRPSLRGVFGANDNTVAFEVLTAAQCVEYSRRLGMSHMRTGIDAMWAWPTRVAGFDWSLTVFDDLYPRLKAEGIKPLPIIGGWPSWMTFPFSAPDKALWLSFWQAFITRYGTYLTDVEFWNEPNIGDWGDGTPDATACASLTTDLATAVRAIKPGLRLIGPAFSHAQSTSGSLEALPAYAAAFFAANGHQQLDAISVHPYGGAAATGVVELGTASSSSAGGASWWAGTSLVIDQVRQAMKTAGVDKPLWITECGIDTDDSASANGAVTEAQQAKVLALLYSLVERDPSLAGMFFHTTVSEADGFFEKAEIVENGTLREKPAFESLRRARLRT